MRDRERQREEDGRLKKEVTFFGATFTSESFSGGGSITGSSYIGACAGAICMLVYTRQKGKVGCFGVLAPFRLSSLVLYTYRKQHNSPSHALVSDPVECNYGI